MMMSRVQDRRRHIYPLRTNHHWFAFVRVLGTAFFVLISFSSQNDLAFCLQNMKDSIAALHLSSDRSQSDKLADVWVTAEGSVPFGEDTTLGDAKARSRDYARRDAVQRAVGTFVQSQSFVYNFQLAEDLVQTTVRGIIVEEHVIQEGAQAVGPEGRMGLMYVTKLKARVRPIALGHKGDIAVKTSLNKAIFTDGDEMEVRVTATRNLYLHVFSIGQDDSVTVLFPNKYVKDNFILAHKNFAFPNQSHKDNGLRLRVFLASTSKKSIERIKVIGTAKKIDLIKGKFPEGTFRVYSGNETGLVTDLLKELAMLDESEWAEATVPYEVREK